MTTEVTYMRRALELARRGIYTTHPNPRVGCVIVKGGEIVGEGFHAHAGGPHAEIVALEAAGKAAQGADVYVTLEPCNHTGRTGACCDALLAAGVAHVFVGSRDPNPLVDGGGVKALEAAGARVTCGVCSAECEALNDGFFSRMRRKRPWVRIKSAISLDGRSALATGKSAWISGEAARRDVQFWRARSDVLMTGHGTALADNPRLNVRLSAAELGIAGAVRQPMRVVADSRLRTSPTAAVYRRDSGRAAVATCAGDAARRAMFRDGGTEVLEFEAEDDRVPLGALFETLSRRFEINEAQVEAGPVLCGKLIEEGLCDELLLYVAPKLIGQRGRALAQFKNVIEDMSGCSEFDYHDTRMVGADMRLLLRPAGV